MFGEALTTTKQSEVVYHIHQLQNNKNIYYIDVFVGDKFITLLHNNLPKTFKNRTDAQQWIQDNQQEILKKINCITAML